MNSSISATYPSAELPDSKSRMGSARDVLSAIQTLIENNTKGERGRKGASLLGMFQGNPPRSSSTQRNAAAKWQANFNTQLGPGLRSAACVPYYNLFEGGPSMAVVELEAPNPVEARRRSRLVTKAFNRAISAADISDAFYRLCNSFVGFGKGFWYWPHPAQWLPSVRAWHEVLFPEHASTDHRKWDWFVVRDTYNPVELQAFVDKQAEGWNGSAVTKAIKASVPQGAREDDWLVFQQALKEHSLATTAQSSAVDVGFCYAREGNGKWSVGIVALNSGGTASGSATAEPEFLYFKRGQFEQVTDFLVPFIYDTADGRINGVSGLGESVYAAVKTHDLMVNSLVDGGFLRTLTVLSPKSASAQVKTGLTVMGGVAAVPPGFDVQPGTVLTDMNGPMTVQRVLLDLVSRTSGTYLPSGERPVGNPDTATGVQAKMSQQTMLTASGVSRFYNRLDVAWTTLFHRMVGAAEMGGDDPETQLAKDFVKECKEGNVTVKDLKGAKCVKAYRVGGSGSAMQRQQNLGALGSLVGAMPASGRQRYFEEYTSATAGPDKIEEFFPVDQDEPGEGDWEARIENTIANSGAPPMLTPNQEHEAHLKGHMQALVAGLQSVEQGADPNTVLAFGQIMLPHCGQTLQAFAQDPTVQAKAKAFGEQLKLIEQQYSTLPQAIEAQQEQAAQQQQLQAVQSGQDPKIQIAAAQAQARTELKAQSMAASTQMKAAQVAQDMQLKAAQAGLDAQIKAGKAVQDVAIKGAKAKAGTKTA
jgi:hypothetical protein